MKHALEEKTLVACLLFQYSRKLDDGTRARLGKKYPIPFL